MADRSSSIAARPDVRPDARPDVRAWPHWPAALLFGLAWSAVAVAYRYSSLAALVATGAVVLYYALVGQAGLLFILIMAILIFGKHHANIRRLLAGEEHRIGARGPPKW